MGTFFSRLEGLRPAKYNGNDAAYARFLGIKPQRYHDWKLKSDAGRDFTPKRELVLQCAKALDIHASELLFGEE